MFLAVGKTIADRGICSTDVDSLVIFIPHLTLDLKLF